MQKIISLFKRSYTEDRLVYNEVVEGAEWVLRGEGIATRKYDGTCCMIRNGKLYKRFDAKKDKKAPEGFEPAQDPDPITGHWPGWILVGEGNQDQWHREGLKNFLENDNEPQDGTYELVGPKVQGNPEGYNKHILIKHGVYKLDISELTYEGIKNYLYNNPAMEGIVWHHQNGNMVKIKYKDFFKKKNKDH